jgi:putative chitinase
MQTKTKIALALVVFAIFAATGARAPSSPSSPKGSRVLTDELIKRIDPNVKKNYASALNPAMTAGSITTSPRVAAFLAQILHESGSFQFLRELASGTAYEGRKDLGNTQPGDGVRYKGRGFIQLTGRANFRSAGSDLGLDLENNPDLAEQPDIAARLAVWFWNKKNLNVRADAGDFVGITRAINGGTRGLQERTRLYESAKQVLSAVA